MVRRLINWAYVLIVLLSLSLLIWYGSKYYQVPVDQRFFDAKHVQLKPSGSLGHGLGIVGSLMMLIGVSSYMIRKRKKSMMRTGKLKHWLEFHMFLCTLGPILVLFHTAFKFGGIVAISFWSMVAVVLSGVIGRFIYNQIPRSIQGKELSLSEVIELKNEISSQLVHIPQLHQPINEILQKNIHKTSNYLKDYVDDLLIYYRFKNKLSTYHLQPAQSDDILRLVKSELSLKRKIKRLSYMQSLFRSWHIVHLPFAIIMLVIMIIHIVITLTFGYRWIL